MGPSIAPEVRSAPTRSLLNETRILPIGVLDLLCWKRRDMREGEGAGDRSGAGRDYLVLAFIVVAGALSFVWICALALFGYKLLLWALGD